MDLGLLVDAEGLVYCGVCGHSMGGKIADGCRYYCCQATPTRQRGLLPRCRWHAVSSSDLDNWVWDQVIRALEDPKLVLREAHLTVETKAGKREELCGRLAQLDKALSSLTQERERAQTMYREGCASLEELKAQLADTNSKQQANSTERQSILAKLGTQSLTDAQAMRGREDRIRSARTPAPPRRSRTL